MKILVVEDEPRIAANIQRGLEMQSWIVDVANNGTEGFDLASSETYDVLILDRMLPEKDGITICRELRKNGIHTPILMLTARTQIEDRVTGLDSGADDYLGKPFAFSELIARVKALARRPGDSVGTTLNTADVELDTVACTVRRGGTLISLSRKEYALLEFLLRNKGKVYSKEQLTELVWGFDDDVLPNTAQVYIGYLRTKIDKAFPDKTPLIATVHGFGYKIVDI